LLWLFCPGPFPVGTSCAALICVYAVCACVCSRNVQPDTVCVCMCVRVYARNYYYYYCYGRVSARNGCFAWKSTVRYRTLDGYSHRLHQLHRHHLHRPTDHRFSSTTATSTFVCSVWTYKCVCLCSIMCTVWIHFHCVQFHSYTPATDFKLYVSLVSPDDAFFMENNDV